MRRLALVAAAILLSALLPTALRADDSESPPGRGPIGKCADASLTFEVKEATVKGGNLTASGTWKASGNADGVYLEMRVNSNRYHAELQQGTGGTFHYETDFGRCGLQVLRVFACPTVKEGGREVECLPRGRSIPTKLDIDCTFRVRILNCAWDCADDASQGCAGTCTAEASGGTLNLVGLWGVDDKDYATVGGPDFGPWTAVVRCKPGEKVTFRVRDQGGVGTLSQLAEIPCGGR